MRYSDIKTLHLFADNGVETEPLSAYGKVTRVGINPQNTRFTDKLIEADITEWEPDQQYDLILAHPPCQFASKLTHSNQKGYNHKNLIPRARKLGKEYADEYIIENVPQAIEKENGLKKEKSTILNGTAFNLPTPFCRAFETSYPVEKPPKQDLDYDNSGFERHNETGGWQNGKHMWKTAKQVTGDYNTRKMKRNGIPAPYIHHLIRYYLLQKEQ